MAEHTKEPWTVKPCPCGQRGCSSAIVEPFVVHTQGAMLMDDAKRAVACVNACEGMADPAAEIARLRAVVDSLSIAGGAVLCSPRTRALLLALRAE